MNPTNTSGGQNPAGQISPIITSGQILPNSIKQRHLYNASSNIGDLYYGRDGSNFIRLPIGATGQVLAVIKGVPAWIQFPQVGLAANKPTAGRFIGDQYLATDTPKLWVYISANTWKGSALS